MSEKTNSLSIGILAGGQSKRMGRDKAFLKVGDKTFIAHICSEMSGFAELLISCRDPEKYAGLEYEKVVDETIGAGPLEGIRCLLHRASCENIFVCAVDMPFVTKELVQTMWEKKDPESDGIIIVHEDRIEPLCAIYHKRILPLLDAMVEQGERRVRALYERFSVQAVSLDETGLSEKAVSNLNTYSEYLSAFSGS